MEEAEDFINLGIVLDNNKVLMIRRKVKEKGKNGSVLEWAFPGGAQRLTESRKECIERTVLSETGYKINFIRQIDLALEHSQFPIAVAYHLCELAFSNSVAKPKESHEVAEIKWVKPKEIRSLITTDLNPNVAKELGLS